MWQILLWNLFRILECFVYARHQVMICTRMQGCYSPIWFQGSPQDKKVLMYPQPKVDLRTQYRAKRRGCHSYWGCKTLKYPSIKLYPWRLNQCWFFLIDGVEYNHVNGTLKDSASGIFFELILKKRERSKIDYSYYEKDSSTSNAYSNWFDVMDEWLDDVKEVKEELKTWSWVLWNDLPFAEPMMMVLPTTLQVNLFMVMPCWTHWRTWLTKPDSLRRPGEQISGNSEEKHGQVFNDLLKKAQTTEITPIRSGLLARGAENVISYMKADPRYRDDMEYKGWALTND